MPVAWGSDIDVEQNLCCEHLLTWYIGFSFFFFKRKVAKQYRLSNEMLLWLFMKFGHKFGVTPSMWPWLIGIELWITTSLELQLTRLPFMMSLLIFCALVRCFYKGDLYHLQWKLKAPPRKKILSLITMVRYWRHFIEWLWPSHYGFMNSLWFFFFVFLDQNGAKDPVLV